MLFCFGWDFQLFEWPSYVAQIRFKIITLGFNIFCWISPKLLLPLMYVVLDGPISYLHKWLFWYMEFHLIWSVFYAYLWWSTAAVEVYTKHCQLQRPCGHKKVFTQTLLRQVITSRMIEKLIVIWWPQRFIVRNKSLEICLRLFQWIPSHWSWMVPCSETQYCSYAKVREFVAVEEEQNSKDFACHKIET